MAETTYTLGINNLNSVDRLVKEQFVAGVKTADTQYEKIFLIDTPTRLDEKFNLVTVNADVTEVPDGGTFDSRGVVELPANTITQKIYKDAVTKGDFAEAFDNYGSIEEAAMSYGVNYETKIDKIAADFLNNVTSTSAPYGVLIGTTTCALAGTTQPIGTTGTTQSNRVSGNLDTTTLITAEQYMMKMKEHNGELGNFTPSRLVVPIEERANAWKITQSTGDPETSSNGLNYVRNMGLQVIPWRRLTSTTGCFLLAAQSKMGMRGLRMMIKQRPSMRVVRLQDSGVTQYQFQMMLGAGVIDYTGLVTIGV